MPCSTSLVISSAAALARVREARGWTQEAAAAAAGLHLRHYQKLEEGSVNATLHTLERLCGAFGLDVQELFEEEH